MGFACAKRGRSPVCHAERSEASALRLPIFLQMKKKIKSGFFVVTLLGMTAKINRRFALICEASETALTHG
jgi:hypothetical protein